MNGNKGYILWMLVWVKGGVLVKGHVSSFDLLNIFKKNFSSRGRLFTNAPPSNLLQMVTHTSYQHQSKKLSHSCMFCAMTLHLFLTIFLPNAAPSPITIKKFNIDWCEFMMRTIYLCNLFAKEIINNNKIAPNFWKLQNNEVSSIVPAKYAHQWRLSCVHQSTTISWHR